MLNLMLAAALAAPPLAPMSAPTFLGIQPGMPAEAAVKALSGVGKVASQTVDDGSSVSSVKGYSVSLCADGAVVFAVTHDLPSDFPSFGKTIALAEAQRGKGVLAIIRPDYLLKPPTYGVEEKWIVADGTQYRVGFLTNGLKTIVAESLFRRCGK